MFLEITMPVVPTPKKASLSKRKSVIELRMFLYDVFCKFFIANRLSGLFCSSSITVLKMYCTPTGTSSGLATKNSRDQTLQIFQGRANLRSSTGRQFLSSQDHRECAAQDGHWSHHGHHSKRCSSEASSDQKEADKHQEKISCLYVSHFEKNSGKSCFVSFLCNSLLLLLKPYFTQKYLFVFHCAHKCPFLRSKRSIIDI